MMQTRKTNNGGDGDGDGDGDTTNSDRAAADKKIWA